MGLGRVRIDRPPIEIGGLVDKRYEHLALDT